MGEMQRIQATMKLLRKTCGLHSMLYGMNEEEMQMKGAWWKGELQGVAAT
jgi:glutamyl-tRNA reductase